MEGRLRGLDGPGPGRPLIVPSEIKMSYDDELWIRNGLEAGPDLAVFRRRPGSPGTAPEARYPQLLHSTAPRVMDLRDVQARRRRAPTSRAASLLVGSREPRRRTLSGGRAPSRIRCP